MNPPRRGRPPDPTRRVAILAAAREIFYSGDAASLTMEAIAQRAGVSKATLYRLFPDIAAVARAVVVEERDAMLAALDTPTGQDEATGERLEATGRRLVAFLASPGHIRLHRALSAHADLRAWMGPLIHAEGMIKTQESLARLIKAMGHADPLGTAQALLGLWQGTWLLAVLLDAKPPPDADEQARIVRAGLALVGL